MKVHSRKKCRRDDWLREAVTLLDFKMGKEFNDQNVKSFFAIKVDQDNEKSHCYLHCCVGGSGNPRCGGTWRDNQAHLGQKQKEPQ